MDNDVAQFRQPVGNVDQGELKTKFLRELATFAVLFLVGLVVLPIAVYLVGDAVFGGYENGGFSAFYGALHSDLRDGVFPIWFLVLSPYLVWQFLRLTIWGYRQTSRAGTRTAS